MSKTVTVLMQRDNIDRQEAEQLVQETMEEIWEAIESGDFLEAEEIWTGNLGLEPDYLLEELF